MARLPAGIRRAELVELLDINDQLKALTSRKKELVDKAKRAHAALPADTYPYGPAVLLLTEARKFDPDSFTTAYPLARHPQYYASTVDRDLIPDELRGKFFTLERRLEVKRAAVTPAAAKPAA